MATKPIGYLQTYDPHLEDDHPYQDQPTGTLGLDQFIGEPDLIGKGHGPGCLMSSCRCCLKKACLALSSILIPPTSQAIKAYKKAGFIAFDTRTSIYGPALLMARDNPELCPRQMKREYNDNIFPPRNRL